MEDAPTPNIIKPKVPDLKSLKLVNEYIKKENQKEIRLILGILNDSISITIKEDINTFKGEFNLIDLQSKDKYFRMFDTIEEAYKEILTTFKENQYNIKIEENNLILNIEIEHSHKKNIIAFILQRNEIKKEDLIESLYLLANNYIKENNGLKQDIINLNNKVNKIEEKLNSFENKLENKIISFEKKIDILIDYIEKTKKEKEIKEKIEKEKHLFSFENVLEKSKIIENKSQIALIKTWLPFINKNNLKCKLIYDAKRDGDKASNFHSLCDYKESTLTIISTSDNKKIGGYLSKSFGGNKGMISDENAFLFSLNYNEKYPSKNSGNNYEDKQSKGPIFGSYCIYIEDNFFSNTNNYYHIISARYNFGKRKDEGNKYCKINDLEIYQIFE